MYLETIFRLVMAPLVIEEGDSLVITAKCHQCHLNFGSWLHHNQQNILLIWEISGWQIQADKFRESTELWIL